MHLQQPSTVATKAKMEQEPKEYYEDDRHYSHDEYRYAKDDDDKYGYKEDSYDHRGSHDNGGYGQYNCRVCTLPSGCVKMGLLSPDAYQCYLVQHMQ